MQQVREQHERKRWGYRFLKEHEIAWITSSATLRQQTGFSLSDRSQQFSHEFRSAHMNPTLYREVYRRHGIRKKRYRWYKLDKNATEESRRHDLARMKR